MRITLCLRNLHLLWKTVARMSPIQIVTRLDRILSQRILPTSYFRWRYTYPGRNKISRTLFPLDDSTSAKKMGVSVNTTTSEHLHTHWMDREVPTGFLEHDDLGPLVERARREYAEEIDEIVGVAEDYTHLVFRPGRNREIRFQEKIDWRKINSQSDANWRHFMHSNRYLTPLIKAYVYTGDDRFSRSVLTFVLEWIDSNPLTGSGTAWNGMTTSQRLLQWLFALPIIKSSSSLDCGIFGLILSSMKGQIDYLDRFLEKDQANNHLLFNLIALVTFCVYFPEFRSSARQKKKALALLEKELEKQVHRDGLSAEQATHYHLIVLWGLLRLIRFMKMNRVPCPESILERCMRMTDALIRIRRPDGRLPMLSDSESASDICDPNDAIALSSVIFKDPRFRGHCRRAGENTWWYLGTEGLHAFDRMESRPAETSVVSSFPDSGYFVVSRGCPEKKDDEYLIFDCGPMGLRRNPFHGHADMLSFEWYAMGQPLIIDPGVYTYSRGVWRDYFRGTSSHNTICLDGHDQSELWGAGRVGRMAHAFPDEPIQMGDFVMVSGSHDGYGHLRNGPIRHRRSILTREPFQMIIWDVLNGTGRQTGELLFHFPLVRVERTGRSGFRISNHDVTLNLDLLHPLEANSDVIFGEVHPPQGWISYRYGFKEPAPVARYRISGEAPLAFLTFLMAFRAKETERIIPSLVTVYCDGEVVPRHRAIGLRFSHQCREIFLLISRDIGGLFEFSGIRTDFRMLQLSREAGGRTRIAGRDGSRLWVGDREVIAASKFYHSIDAVYEHSTLNVLRGVGERTPLGLQRG